MKPQAIWQVASSKVLRFCTLAWAAVCYLVEPDAAFMAVWLAVAMDLVSRLIAISVQAEGFLPAVRSGSLSSKKAFVGTFRKLVAYFVLGVICTHSRYVVNLELATVLTKTVVYAFLFTVETVSILENLISAGFKALQPLLDSVKGAFPQKNN